MSGTGRNRIVHEGTIMKQSAVPLYENMITDDEMSFLVVLFEIVEDLVKLGEKVSLLRISKRINVSPTELLDYIDEIMKFEARSKSRFLRNS